MLDPVLGGFNFLPPSTETEEPILDVSDLSNSLRAVSDDALSSLLLWETMYVSLEEDRPLESWDSLWLDKAIFVVSKSLSSFR